MRSLARQLYDLPKESKDNIIPLSHLLHFNEDICVPSSVGSEHLEQAQAKYFVSRRCSLLIIVGSSECA